MTRSDLAAATYEWSMQWWDHDAHMVWNPPGSVDPGIEARKLHLVPNTAWLAYAQLASGGDAAGAEALAAIRVLVGLQYDRPGTVVHGTYRRFLEWPDPPVAPVMWEDYDPNWRQFVGTTLALILEDFSDRLDGEALVLGQQLTLRLGPAQTVGAGLRQGEVAIGDGAVQIDRPDLRIVDPEKVQQFGLGDRCSGGRGAHADHS